MNEAFVSFQINRSPQEVRDLSKPVFVVYFIYEKNRPAYRELK